MIIRNVKRNEDATAGGLAGLFMLFVVAAIIIALLAPVVDKTNDMNNNMISVSGLPVSQDRMTTMSWLTVGFSSIAFVVLLAAGLNYWVQSIRSQNSEV